MSTQKLYVARYALSEGIIVVETDAASPNDGWVRPHGYHIHLKIGRDIFKTREAAIIRANELCDKKIASLQRQIQKLNGMEFK